jgi:hypothetical protein
MVCIALAKLFNDPVDECCLRKGDGVVLPVMLDGDAKGVFNGTEVRELLVIAKLHLEVGVLIRR